MAAMKKKIKKAFIKYTKEHYPDEEEKIIRKAEEGVCFELVGCHLAD